ncbi:MAG: ABC transporter permease subunit [Acidobacteriota bacterium]
MPADSRRRSSWAAASGTAVLVVVAALVGLTLWQGFRQGFREETLAAARQALSAALLAIALAAAPAAGTALYVSEFLDGPRRRAGKCLIELLAAFPLLVWALLVWERLVAGPSLPLLTGLLLLVALPHLATLAEEALHSVPLSSRQTAHRLGATVWQTSCRVVLPAAWNGLRSALTLTFVRVLAEAATLLWIADWSARTSRLPDAGSSPGSNVIALAAALILVGFALPTALQWVGSHSAKGRRS